MTTRLASLACVLILGKVTLHLELFAMCAGPGAGIERSSRSNETGIAMMTECHVEIGQAPIRNEDTAGGETGTKLPSEAVKRRWRDMTRQA
jgi:hypothetical protein